MKTLHLFPVVTLLLCWALLCAVPAQAVTAMKSGPLPMVHVKEGKLTVKAENVSLKTLLEEIGKQSKIAIRFHGSGDEKISANLNDIPLAVGLKRLVRNYSHSFIYKVDGQTDKAVVTRLMIYSRTGSNAPIVEWQPETAEEAVQTNNPEDVDSDLLPEPSDTRDPLNSTQELDPLVQSDLPPLSPGVVESTPETAEEDDLAEKLAETDNDRLSGPPDTLGFFYSTQALNPLAQSDQSPLPPGVVESSPEIAEEADLTGGTTDSDLSGVPTDTDSDPLPEPPYILDPLYSMQALDQLVRSNLPPLPPGAPDLGMQDIHESNLIMPGMEGPAGMNFQFSAPPFMYED